jgi:hypothetical protein
VGSLCFSIGLCLCGGGLFGLFALGFRVFGGIPGVENLRRYQ